MEDQTLEGIRILEFGSFIAGPFAGVMLSQLGAEVIKVENPKRPEGGRYFVNAPKAPLADPKYGGQWFDVNNMNKKSITVDFTKNAGKEIVLAIAKRCDVIIENMPPGVIAKYGLGYDEIKKINPKIVYISSCACGQTGPEKDFKGYASHFANKAGLGNLTGYKDWPPSQFTGSIDTRSAIYTVVAVITSLIYRENNGIGQYCDLASQEVMASQLGDVYIGYITNGIEPERTGNYREGYAPNNAYRCIGEDEWVSISIENQEQWVNLCDVMGMPELAEDVRFNNYEKRFNNQQELDTIITSWTCNKNNYDITKMLQMRNIPAAPTLNNATVTEDEHIIDRKYFEYIDHPKLGKDFVGGPCWHFSKTPAKNKRHAPIFGEHTEEYLKGMLGKSDEEIDLLRRENII